MGKLEKIPNGIPDNLVPFVCQVATGKLENSKFLVRIIRRPMALPYVTIYMWSIWQRPI